MWKQDRVWIHYVKNIIAADMGSAIFLASYLRRVGISKEYLPSLEIFDLHKYKVVKGDLKVQNALREKRGKPFIFVSCKN